jgi:hypothetical protein
MQRKQSVLSKRRNKTIDSLHFICEERIINFMANGQMEEHIPLTTRIEQRKREVQSEGPCPQKEEDPDKNKEIEKKKKDRK